MLIFADTESVGLVGPTKMLQFCINDGEPELIPLFMGWESDQDTLDRLGEFLDLLDRADTVLVLYQAVHDLMHLYRLKHRMQGLAYDSSVRPILPFKCKVIDMQTHAATKSDLAPFAFSKGPSRGVAKVSKIPIETMKTVEAKVGERIRASLPECVRPHLKCAHKQVKDSRGRIRPDLVTLVWYIGLGVFSLKGLMRHYGFPTLKLSELWPLPTGEVQLYPYPQPCHDEIEPICDTIMSDPEAPFWTYAKLDPLFTRYLWEQLGQPVEPTDNDEMAACVGYTRYYGFDLDQSVLELTEQFYRSKIEAAEKLLAGINLGSSKQRLALLRQYDPLIMSSRKEVVGALAKTDRPCAPIAQAMLDYGIYHQRLDQVLKARGCRTGRLHVDLKVLGTATNRMAGSGAFNIQGIAQAEYTKRLANGEPDKKSPLAGLRAAIKCVAGGDFDALEVNVAAYAYGCEQLQRDVNTPGFDLHLMTAVLVSPLLRREYVTMGQEKAYEWAMAAKVDKAHADHGRVLKARKEHGKRVVFATLYGCEAAKIAEILGCSIEEAQAALDRFFGRYRGVGEFRRANEAEVCTADTETWDRNSVAKMVRSVESLFGYRRNWDFEARTAEIMWQIGQSGIRLAVDGTVIRSEEKGKQSFANAVRSACLGAAISIQAAVARQRANAPIQIAGSECCKRLAADIWRAIRLPMINCHDELIFPSHPNFDLARIKQIESEFLTERRRTIPTLSIKIEPMKRWSDK